MKEWQRGILYRSLNWFGLIKVQCNGGCICIGEVRSPNGEETGREGEHLEAANQGQKANVEELYPVPGYTYSDQTREAQGHSSF